MGSPRVLKVKANNETTIKIRGARQNNLKDLNVDFKPGTWTVITGPSGSGKSSLAFDTLYAEGQRRYVETFSPYARQFLDRCDRPQVDKIEGVPPAIAIDQTNTVRTSRSTVGTMTELNDYLKLLFAHEAELYCKGCGEKVSVMTPVEMWADIYQKALKAKDPRLVFTFDVLIPKSSSLDEAKLILDREGFTHIHAERKTRGGTLLSVVVDRFKAGKVDMSRAIETVEKALSFGRNDYKNKFVVHAVDEEGNETIWPYAGGRVCASCNISYGAPSSSVFSFNSAVGACPTCKGFGRIIDVDIDLVIPDKTKSLKDGAVKLWAGKGAYHDSFLDMMRYAKRDSIRVDVPFEELTQKEKDWVIEGEPSWSGKWSRQWYGIRHFFKWLETKAYKLHVRVLLARYRGYTLCPVCEGARLKEEGLLWRLGSFKTAKKALGSRAPFCPRFLSPLKEKIASLPGLTVHDVMLSSVDSLADFFDDLKKETKNEAGAFLIKEIATRLHYLKDVGVGYLTLDRQSRTLSGGEVQRVNLTTALGTNLVGTLFVLDEPSVGLHPRDMDRVNAILTRLKETGNTLVVVEHDPQVMLCADRIIDMGPGAGERGGSIVYDGKARDIRSADTLTALYLSGELTVDARLSRIAPSNFKRWITLKGAAEHNLKNVTASFPMEAICAVTGVSGSGKSTLIVDTLVPALSRALGESKTAGKYKELLGVGNVKAVHFVDQSSIGKTTRSNAALYSGAFTGIRNLFASTPKAAARGYAASHFSFNSGQGRCPTCAGAGFERVEMQFLSDVFLRCPDCNGKRYRNEILEVTVNLDGKKDLSIADVLDMTVSQAQSYFRSFTDISRALLPLMEVGLGYLKLGQPVTTLSGGEAQRLKLSSILAESRNKTNLKGDVYIFDEPTTGLHFDDVAKLLSALRRIVRAGATVIVVEHNLDVINAADWIVDLGPEGGDAGGKVLFTGTPDEITESKLSYTGRALKAYRKTLKDAKATMKGLFKDKETPTENHGRSLQSVWRNARTGDMGIFGAREHNLKDLNVVVPKNKLSVVTGVSGSGKSTLAFGVVFSEGQRRYLESINAYARSIVQPGAKADVDQVIGIAPTVAIEQRTSRGGKKSTVATLTEIQHFLRLIYVKLGVQHCPACGVAVKPQSTEAIFSSLLTNFKGKTLTLCAPLIVARKGLHTETASFARSLGIAELRVDGEWVSVKNFPNLSRYSEHTIEMPLGSVCLTETGEEELKKTLKAALFHGHGVVTVIENKGDKKKEGVTILSTKRACPVCARSFPEPDPRLFSFNSKMGWCPTCFGTGALIKGFDAEQTGEEAAWDDVEAKNVCPTCNGTRLNEIAQHVFFKDLSITDIAKLSVDNALTTLSSFRLVGREKSIGEDALKEIISRLTFLKNVGLGYLTLNRDAPSLSGGEAQRIRLASQLGNNLQGVCYVLDEPTIGLHPRDNTRLVTSLLDLRDKGNTVLVVEHDEETIRRADHIIDIGPGAGTKGGELLAEGTIEEIENTPQSLTGYFLKHPLFHAGLAKRPISQETKKLTLKNASLHNLKNLTCEIPLGHLVVLTGVSGSGKSTLARDVLLPTLQMALAKKKTAFETIGCEGIDGIEAIDRILEVDQSPIGKTPRSSPATYIGFFDLIRSIYSQTPEAKEKGWTASRFSYNTGEGRCPVCDGQGEITVEMNFLPDVKIPCEACHGMRFDEETLKALWHGKSIGEILLMSVDEALELFTASPKIAATLKLMQEIGLGYLKLGQPSSTLSGGEAQRIKLVTELIKADTSDLRHVRRIPKTLYILDEPTVGLHMADVDKLISVLHRLVDAGNTVLTIEHNLDVIAEADYIIDLGPEGGPEGGSIVGTGTPKEIARQKTATGTALNEFLRTHSHK